MRGKNYVDSAKEIDRDKKYDVEEAVSLVKKSAKAKFDETIELHIRTGCDGRHAEQQIRGAVVLPNGTGKDVKVLVFAKGPKADEAEAAGADYVGADDLVTKITSENWFDYDVIVAAPDMMAQLGKIGRVLGPKGLMPNPKTGTVTMDTKKAVTDIKKGMVEYKTDSYGNVHTVIGKVSFDEKMLLENLNYVVSTIVKAKPSVVKGKYITNISISSTMGPGIKIDQNSFDI